jgi:hypothetical protein
MCGMAALMWSELVFLFFSLLFFTALSGVFYFSLLSLADFFFYVTPFFLTLFHLRFLTS